MTPKYGKGKPAERPPPRPLSRDEYLRGFGYTIFGRPVGLPAIWKAPDGSLLCEETAAAACRRKVKELETCRGGDRST